jgi:hypothetical protein
MPLRETARLTVRQHYPLSRTRANEPVAAAHIDDIRVGDRKDVYRQGIGVTTS